MIIITSQCYCNLFYLAKHILFAISANCSGLIPPATAIVSAGSIPNSRPLVELALALWNDYSG